MLLHSYILVKYLIPLGDHATAARMLLRVAKREYLSSPPCCYPLALRPLPYPLLPAACWLPSGLSY